MNIISFDTEEWFFEKSRYGNRREMFASYDDYLDRILDALDERGYKATFFCVGELANTFPEVIRKIDNRGHEIGCHSNEHIWLSSFSREQLFDDTKKAIGSIEDAIGKKVLSYRAPAFSIGENNKWAFEVLAECGIKRDSSVYPSTRDFGGFSSFPTKSPCLIEVGGIKIKEFPICLSHHFGRDFAFSGGGYFRLFPFHFIVNEMRKSDYNICYFHLEDLMYQKMVLHKKDYFEKHFKMPATLKNRTVRMLKASVGTKGAFGKMIQLLNSFEYVNLDQADSLMDWEHSKCISL